MNTTPDATSIAAIDRVLAADPRNVRALIAKADHYVTTGDTRSASAFYLAALRAAPAADKLAPELAPHLRRAQETCARLAREYKDYLRSRLVDKGFDAPEHGRFAQALDIAFGEKRIYVQEPRFFYFPGLPNIQFYERELFPWMDEVEAETGAIRAELLEVLRTPGSFSPYVTGSANRPRKDEQGMLNNPDWSAFYFLKNGEPVRENMERCPSVMRALRNAPLPHMPNRSPVVLFSLLKPGTHIPPHNGFVNTRLICHLPLIVPGQPGQCRLRVGNDTRPWVEGKAWAFDDSIDHEAWNDSDQTRVILLFDIWRPEIRPVEQALVTELFAAIDAYNGTKPDWDT
jgi:aspartyl/asparaginyl beta-hydroxylase (cupin superfamily)